MADWSKILSRGNVEDRRGAGALAIGGGGGLVGLVIYLLFTFMGGAPADMGAVLEQLQQQSGQQQALQPGALDDGRDYPTFASTVLGSNNDAWRRVFEANNRTYTEPRLVLFRSATQSGCGLATAQVGPHYCPADQTIYLDETFFDVLQQQFKAKGGDVAEAYVIAHEVGHHVQNLLGTMDAFERAGSARRQELSVALELQADCFAGVWAHSVSSQGVFEPGEINEAIDAAAAVGDDRIQKTTEGRVNPETWTHGSSAQRSDWFNRGAAAGNPSSCDTFN